MPNEKFLELANSDPRFAAWLGKVDKLCMRFLDIDFLSIPEAQAGPYFPDHAYDEHMSPEEYFLWLVGLMKESSPSTAIDVQFARMVKWGVQWPPISG